MLNANVIVLGYLVAAVCFVLALRGLSNPETARRGNQTGMVGMAIAVVFTLLNLPDPSLLTYVLIGAALGSGALIGTYIARNIAMTAMPQLVAGFHSLVGLAAVFVAVSAYYSPESYGILSSGEYKLASLFEMGIGIVIGAITFSGSVIAFGKLQGKIPPEIAEKMPGGLVSFLGLFMRSKPIMLPQRHLINGAIGAAIVLLLIWFMASALALPFWLMTALAFVIGFLLIIPIGGADMPVVVSMLNSYSGWAAAGIGFTLNNQALIITGALVGSSGAILSYIMCTAMNRSFISVILGGWGETGTAAVQDDDDDRIAKQGSAEDAAYIMKNAQKVIIVPGYGMAVAQAQHAVREMTDALNHAGVDVTFAIHPVAGRMPGHMNVLLAEANVPYDIVHEMEDINAEFQSADVAYVIGANDITNPSAKSDSTSPIYGMPILDVERSTTVLFVKRSLASGYAGIDNPLFFADNTMMLFGDAKKMTEEIVRSLED